MNLLNTIALPNQLVAHGKEYLAVYSNGVVKTYRKNSITNDLTLMPITYAVVGVLAMRMSIDGSIVAVQTDSQTIRLQNGTQTVFDNVGKFDIANTGHLIIVDPVNGAVQVITQSTTNITASVTPDDRVAVGRQGYIVYNTARTLTAAKFADVVFTNTASAKEIVFAMHVKDDKYALFFKDGTASYDGVTRTVAGPFMGWREFGSHVLSTDYKQDYYVSRFNPITDSKILRPFKWDLPPALNNDYSSMLLMVPGSGYSSVDFDLKNKLAVVSNTAVTSVADSPYGPTGKSLKFNGTTSILQTADSANIQLGANDFTIELFLKVENADVSSVAFHKGADSTAAPSYVLTVTSNKSFNFNISTNGTAYAFTLLDVGKFELGVWTHVAITRKGDKYRFFQDGKMRGSFTLAGALFAHTGKGIQFGHYRTGNYTTGTPTSLLNGSINGFQILNYAKYLHDFYVETLSTTADIPRAKGPANLAFEVPATLTSSLAFNNTNKQITSVSPLKYVDQTGAVVTLPAQSFDSGAILRPMTDDVIVADRSYSGFYYISFNGGQSWVAYSPSGSLGGYQGHACMFKGVLHVLHGVTNTNSTIRKFTNLPNQTSNDIAVGLPFLMALGLDSNENAMVMSSGTSTRIYITWDGTAYYDYPLAPITYSNAAIEYVGNNVFLITNQLANIRHFYYVPTTPGTPQLLGTIPTDYRRVMQFAQNLVVYKLGQLLSKPYPKRVDGFNATQAEAQAYVDFIMTIPIDGAANTTLAGSAITPLYKQNRISIGNGTTSQIWDV